MSKHDHIDDLSKFKQAPNVVNENVDNFGYASYGDIEHERFGAISFFKYVTEWEDKNTTKQETYSVANIRMNETLLLQLARFIIEQHEKSKKIASEKQ